MRLRQVSSSASCLCKQCLTWPLLSHSGSSSFIRGPFFPAPPDTRLYSSFEPRLIYDIALVTSVSTRRRESVAAARRNAALDVTTSASNHDDHVEEPIHVSPRLAAKRARRSQSEEHRAKRVKTENDGDPRPNEPDESIALVTEPRAATAANADAEPAYDIDALVTQAAQAVIATMSSQQHVEGDHDARPAVGDEAPANGLISTGDAQAASARDVDFSAAPSDPTELALWVAKQISNFGEGARDSVESESSERQRHHLHPPASYIRRYDEDSDPTKAAERERVREENRERKKRWRESNAERSMYQKEPWSWDILTSLRLDKDNDLRCRINKRAKTLWGHTVSVERSAWIEAEFNKRRAKRESKERVHSFDEGFPGFAFAPGFGSTLFPAPGVGPQGETNAAGLLLANALLGVGSNGTGPNADAANALKAALENGAVDPKPFTEALRAMAANPEIMNGINAILGGYSGYDDVSGDEDSAAIMQSTEITNNPATQEERNGRQPSEADDEQSEIVKKLNQATAMLNELHESNGAKSGTNGFTAINGNESHGQPGRSEKSDSGGDDNGHGLDQAQIDALLTLANGGALTGTEGRDDDRLLSLAENLNQQQEQGNGPQPDSDMSAILQRIIQQVMVQREERSADDNNAVPPEPSTEPTPPAPPSQSSHPDPFGVAKNPAMALSSLLHCAGMSINTVIPAAQSHATSQLYARLSNHSRSSTPSGGGINPAHASAFGSTAMMNRKLLARPNAYSRPLHTPNTTLRASPLGPPAKPRDPNEERKARSFGFPPLPGRRMMISRKH